MDERTSTHCLHGKFLQTADVTGTFSSLVNLEQIIPGESEDSSNRGKKWELCMIGLHYVPKWAKVNYIQ